MKLFMEKINFKKNKIKKYKVVAFIIFVITFVIFYIKAVKPLLLIEKFIFDNSISDLNLLILILLMAISLVVLIIPIHHLNWSK